MGGGSAGAVIANRLSKNNKVLLLEAGGEPLYFNSIPGFAPYMLNRYRNRMPCMQCKCVDSSFSCFSNDTGLK